jgi:transcription elongation factor GreA
LTVAKGMHVTVFDERSSAEHSYRIVAPNQADPSAGLLSAESPVARALMGHSSGDTVAVSTPRGPRRLRIISLA